MQFIIRTLVTINAIAMLTVAVVFIDDPLVVEIKRCVISIKIGRVSGGLSACRLSTIVIVIVINYNGQL